MELPEERSSENKSQMTPAYPVGKFAEFGTKKPVQAEWVMELFVGGGQYNRTTTTSALHLTTSLSAAWNGVCFHRKICLRLTLVEILGIDFGKFLKSFISRGGGSSPTQTGSPNKSFSRCQGQNLCSALQVPLRAERKD